METSLDTARLGLRVLRRASRPSHRAIDAGANWAQASWMSIVAATFFGFTGALRYIGEGTGG